MAEELEKPLRAIVGMELALKVAKEHPVVCNAIGAHHDEIEMTSLISPDPVQPVTPSAAHVRCSP